MNNVLTMILAGGEGTRLYPLTKDRAKPAVPFGGRYRVIDFVLSNFINSGFYKIKVLTQFKSNSLINHLSRAWTLSPFLNQYVDPVPAQMRVGKDWFKGTADAVYQNLNLIFDENPEYVNVFSGDHIYKMDVRQMMAFHIDAKADVTVAVIPKPVKEAALTFGVVEVDKNFRIIGFEEKPKKPKQIPGKPGMALVSMGNYIFNANVIVEVLERDALKDTSHDFGKTIIPQVIKTHKVYAYDFNKNEIAGLTEPERGYWRDIGSIDSYWQANMDLVAVTPVFNLYNSAWPIRVQYTSSPPAKFVFADKKHSRIGIATDSLVSEGSIISGGQVNRSILFSDVRINSYAQVTDSIIMDGVNIGRYCRIKNAIIDKGSIISPNTVIGYKIEDDKKRFMVSSSGIVVLQKGTMI